MKKIVLFCSLCLSSTLYADSHWGYSHQNAPSHWASLDQKYQACAGFNQSPINISQTTKSQLERLKLNYTSTSKSIVNNGHTIQVDFNEGNVRGGPTCLNN